MADLDSNDDASSNSLQTQPDRYKDKDNVTFRTLIIDITVFVSDQRYLSVNYSRFPINPCDEGAM